jgi:3-deoxy-manno-octulosonate cytidylyltransferase (CMP-KDO synthetase)
MKVVGVIPARFASTRFPGKPLAKILNKEMIAWVLEGAIKAKNLDQVWLATDDEKIAEVGRRVGVQVALTDPDLPSGSDRIWAAIQNVDCDVVINIQGDEPLVQSEWIEKLIEPFSGEAAQGDPSTQMSTLATTLSLEELNNPNVVKVICNQLGHAIYFSRFPIPFSRQTADASRLSIVKKHVGMYGYRKSFLKQFCAAPASRIELAESLEQLRALELGAKIAVREIHSTSLGVDTPEDLNRVEAVIKKIPKG